MVAKGKERLKPASAVVPQEESRESTVVDTVPAQTRSIEECSDKERVGAEHLHTLRKRVSKQEEYTRLLQWINELEQEQSDLTSHPLRTRNEGITPQGSKGPRFEKHTIEYRGRNV